MPFTRILSARLVMLIGLLAFVPMTQAAGPNTIGLSYVEVTAHLAQRFNMQKTTDAYDGLPRYMGKTQAEDALGVLTVVGQRADISRASMTLFLPDNAPQIVAHSVNISLQFLANIAPNWNRRIAWFQNAMEISRQRGEQIPHVRGSSIIAVKYSTTTSAITLTIKPAKQLQ